MDIIIRRAHEGDTEALERFFQSIRQQTFKARPLEEFKIGDYRKSTEEDLVWVATHKGTVVGFISIFMPSFIHNLFVEPMFQNQGVGTKLLQKAEQKLTEPIDLKIALDNLKACPFYEKHGYREVSVHREAPEPYMLYRKVKISR